MAADAQGTGESNHGVSRSAALKLGGLGVAAAAASLAAPGSAKAADGDPLVLGSTNNLATQETQVACKGSPAFLFTSETSGATDACIWACGPGSGLRGCGADGIFTPFTLVEDVGVHGITTDTTGNGAGVFGENQSAGIGVRGESAGGVAVKGVDTSESTTGLGVWGSSTSGTGVRATTQTGTAIVAQGNSGTALSVEGPAQFSNCGVATIHGTTLKPKDSVVVSPVILTANSLVLATLQTNLAGVYIQSAVPAVTSAKVTITLSAAVTRSVKVAWFAVDVIPPSGPA